MEPAKRRKLNADDESKDDVNENSAKDSTNDNAAYAAAAAGNEEEGTHENSPDVVTDLSKEDEPVRKGRYSDVVFLLVRFPCSIF